jgi:hypothetical protein
MSPIQDVAPLDPDWDLMQRREAEGAFVVWVCRAGKTLAGFISFHLITHLDCRSTSFAIDGSHYLSPEWRKSDRLWFRMWRTAEPALKARGAQIVMAHDSARRPLLAPFLALGYKPLSTTFWKKIG